MAATAPPQIIINDPSASSSNTTAQPTPSISTASSSTSSSSSKPSPPTLNTQNTSSSLLNRTHTPTSPTTTANPACYLCDEQNPGDFSPTTKHLDTCVLCSRYFCPIHHSPQYPATAICNINHSTYYHEMLLRAKAILNQKSQTGEATSPIGGNEDRKRDLAELLIQEGIYPSLGEREKAIFATSPVDEQKMRELNSWRSLDAAVANGGERGVKGTVEVRDVVGSDIAI